MTDTTKPPHTESDMHPEGKGGSARSSTPNDQGHLCGVPTGSQYSATERARAQHWNVEPKPKAQRNPAGEIMAREIRKWNAAAISRAAAERYNRTGASLETTARSTPKG